MLRLTDYLKVGGRLAAGDKCYNTKNEEDNEFDGIVAEGRPFAGQYEFIGKGFGIYDSEDIKSLVIKSFANRDNNGAQQVPDDFPVVICGNNGVERSKLAIDVEWNMTASRSSNGAYYAIKSWKPDIDKLLEQQNEYDKQQAIESKESKMSEFKEHQRVYVKNSNCKSWFMGCETLDGKHYIVLSKMGHMVVEKKRVSETPFKTELEIAKEKQIEGILNKYTGDKKQKEYLKDILEWMQFNGDLAEIILPLKDK